MTPPPDNFDTPPGTVRLIREDGELVNARLILQPTPSNDPNDPLNWRLSRKLLHFMPILALTAVIFTHYNQLNAALAINYAGTAVGCIFFIPFAIKYGRRHIYIISSAVMLATAAWQACMHTVLEMYLSSLIFGLASATNETIVQMTVADVFFIHQHGTANGAYTIVVLLGSFLSPMIAGYMAQNGDWRLCFWVTFAVQGLLLFYICLFFEESKYIPQLTGSAPDNRHAPSPAKSGTAQSVEDAAHKPESQADKWTSADCDLSADIPILTWKQKLRLFTKTEESLWRLFCLPFIILFQFPAVAYTSFQYAFTLCWISAQASIISIAFAEPPYNYGTIGLGNMNAPPPLSDVFLGQSTGASSPTAQLFGSPAAITAITNRKCGCIFFIYQRCASVLVSLCLASQQPSIGGAILGFGFGSNLDLSITVLVDSYQDLTGESFVAVAFVRNALSIGMFFGLVPWLNAQGLQNLSIVMGVIAIAAGFLHIPLQIWGKRLRIKTQAKYKQYSQERRGVCI
ncbi:hypothetical protein NQ176_g1608 [Zarea fungicola]|uniref:Uncharacterized protein n=1 Tax=Zarea fungicola TaxID=93591 RepID=A0ACC1NUL6_9HYPO|nr:hypothetical protein NQ176_g1608 [Lecanicillium fungicola]